MCSCQTGDGQVEAEYTAALWGIDAFGLGEGRPLVAMSPTLARGGLEALFGARRLLQPESSSSSSSSSGDDE